MIMRDDSHVRFVHVIYASHNRTSVVMMSMISVVIVRRMVASVMSIV